MIKGTGCKLYKIIQYDKLYLKFDFMNLKFFELALNSSFKDIRWEFIKEGFLREKVRKQETK